MKNIWEKIKAFFSRIWQGLTWAGRIIIGIILVVIIALAVYAVSNDKKDNKNNDNKDPEVAQVYEPSIGSPLPATTTPSDNSGTVAGDSTASTTPGTDSKPTNMMVAPAAGIDPNEPVVYENNDLQFIATLPAGVVVDESQAGKIIFTSAAGKLLYVISTSAAGAETMSSIQSQLSNSPSATNIKNTSFAGQAALSFEAKEHGQGIAFITKDKTYYLLGNSKYFSDFKIL